MGIQAYWLIKQTLQYTIEGEISLRAEVSGFLEGIQGREEHVNRVAKMEVRRSARWWDSEIKELRQ